MCGWGQSFLSSSGEQSVRGHLVREQTEPCCAHHTNKMFCGTMRSINRRRRAFIGDPAFIRTQTSVRGHSSVVDLRYRLFMYTDFSMTMVWFDQLARAARLFATIVCKWLWRLWKYCMVACLYMSINYHIHFRLLHILTVQGIHNSTVIRPRTAAITQHIQIQ